MKSVSKALSLLSQFTVSATPKPLGAIAADAGLDKATTRRMLVAMCEFGIVEQDPSTRKYTLGPAVLSFARSREALHPIQNISEEIITEVAGRTGETAHFSVPTKSGMSVLRVAESPRTIRAHIDEGAILPFHTTGAGIAYLSACDAATVDRILSGDLASYTPDSYTTPQQVRDAIAEARSLGHAATSQTFGIDSSGLAVPVLLHDGRIAGVIGVTTPSERMNSRVRQAIVERLRMASEKIAMML